MRHKHLFIMSPPYSGSTALWQLLQSSESVAALPDEGQKLPELAAMMRSEPWNPKREFDWPLIRRTWRSYWDLSRPVLLEKSPPHLCRYRALEAHFEHAHYLLLLRDPSASCEALHRRNGMPYGNAARRWLDWLELHLECRRELNNTHVIYYEDMTDDPESTFAGIAEWMPELKDVDYGRSVTAHSVHGVKHQALTNLNANKLERLSVEDARAVRDVLETKKELLSQTPYSVHS